MCPEEMERRSTASIFKESAAILHMNYRVFLAFVLVYCLPMWIILVLVPLFLSKDPVNNTQTIGLPGVVFFSMLKPGTIYFLFLVVTFFGEVDGLSRIRADLNNSTTTDDLSMVPKSVLSFDASLRIYIRGLWMALAFLLLSFLFVSIGGILPAIILATAGRLDPKSFFDYAFSPVLSHIIALAILVALVQVILVRVHWRRETREEKCSNGVRSWRESEV